MGKERLDSKGRVLYPGESERKDGGYTFRYYDVDGVRRAVYSSRLTEDDPLLPGKKDGPYLRELEARIQQHLAMGHNPPPKQIYTLDEVWHQFLKLKCDISEDTLVSYIYLYNRHVRPKFGNRPVDSIRYSDLKTFFIELLKNGYKVTTLNNISIFLHPTFEFAVREGYILLNPSKGLAKEFNKRKDWAPEKQRALTVEEQNEFLEFVGSSYRYRHWMPMITTFLGTGMRLGELIGLTWNDVDFAKGRISVNHTLQYKTSLDGKTRFYISSPKSRAGNREIPMLKDVKEALLGLYERREDFSPAAQTSIDGYTDFVFRDINGNVISPSRINYALKKITCEYNGLEQEKAKQEEREPKLLPDITVHHFRHTFATRFCENENNIKVIQKILGHANIETTMHVYAEATGGKQKEAIAALEGKIRIK